MRSVVMSSGFSTSTCRPRRAAARACSACRPDGVPTMTASRGRCASIAEHILPETDSPGARAVGVHRFIDAMLADSSPDEERRRFLAGLADVDARARQSHGRGFLRCATHEQRSLLDQLDREAFAAPLDRAATPFFRTMKELTLVG